MKTFTIIALLTVLGLFGCGSRQEGDTVTLQSDNGPIQMFSYIPGGYVSDSANAKTTVFPAGTQCTVAMGPTTLVIKGTSVSYYYLNCNHIYGHVNAKLVR